MILGLAVDHGGFSLKKGIVEKINSWGYAVVDFGAYQLKNDDDYPDVVVPLVNAIVCGRVGRGIIVCGSGIGVCIASNKFQGIRAAVISDMYSARQGVEHDNINIMCIGARIIGFELLTDLLKVFLHAQFTGAERHVRRLEKITRFENPRSSISEK